MCRDTSTINSNHGSPDVKRANLPEFPSTLSATLSSPDYPRNAERVEANTITESRPLNVKPQLDTQAYLPLVCTNYRSGAAALKANFTAEPISGAAPLMVVFTNTTTGNANSYLWDFGDGLSATLKHPAHVYGTPGTYTVALTAIGENEDWRELPRHIERINAPDTAVSFLMQTGINAPDHHYYLYYGHPAPGQPPELYPDILGGSLITFTGDVSATVGFTTSADSGLAPLVVTFTNVTTPSVGNNYTWDFGDGETSFAENPVHTYTSPGPGEAGGAYSVTLTADTGAGAVITLTRIAAIQVPALDVSDQVAVEFGARENPLGVAVICPSSAPQVFYSADARTAIAFPPGSVTETLVMTHTPQAHAWGARSGLAFYDIQATTANGAPVTTFAQAVVFETRYDGAAIQPAWLEQTLAAFRWDENTQAWIHLPTTLDAGRDTVQYRATHFSEYAVMITGAGASGGDAEAKESQAASAISAAQSDLFSGAATWAYPLHVPPGQHGLQPDLTLKYNSHLAEAEQTDTQRSGWVGLGFTLDVGYIDIEMNSLTRGRYLESGGCYEVPGLFDAYLVLDGARSKLAPTSLLFPNAGKPNLVQTFRMQHDNFMRVELWQEGAANGAQTETLLDLYDFDTDQVRHLHNLYWQAIAKDGTLYRFGYTADSAKVKLDAVGFDPGDSCGNFHLPAAITWTAYPGRAYLDQVEDVYGNRMNLSYESEMAEARLYYVVGDDEAIATQPYNFYARLKQITYGQRRQVTFEYDTPRQDRDAQEEARMLVSQSAQIYPSLLSAISMAVNNAAFLRYEFGYQHIPFHSLTKKTKHPVLTTITVKDGNGQAFEAPTTLAYYDTWAHPVKGSLRQIDNGYGGKVTFSYEWFGHTKRVTKIKTEAPNVDPIVQYFVQARFPEIGRTWVKREVWTWTEGENISTQYLFYARQDWWPFDDKTFPVEGQLAQVNVFDATIVDAKFRALIAPRQSTCYEYDAALLEQNTGNVFVAPKSVNVVYDGYCNLQTGLVTEYAYNAYGDQTAVIERGDPSTGDDDRTTVTAFNFYGWDSRILTLPSSQTVSGSGSSFQTSYTYLFYPEGIAQKATTQGGVTTVEHYNNRGEVDWARDGKGNVTITAYDDGFPTRARYANGLETRAGYDVHWGVPLWEEGFNGYGERVTHHYDTFGRPVETSGPGGRTQTAYTRLDGTEGAYGYRVTTVAGVTETLTTTSTYNGIGQLIQTRSAGAAGTVLTDHTYDALGRARSTSSPYYEGDAPALWSTTDYDPLGRVSRAHSDISDIHYSYSGWRTETVTDEEGHPTTYVKDGRGRTVAVEQTLTGTLSTTYRYNALDQVTQMTDAAGNVVTMTYDALGRATIRGDPDMGVWQYRYDGAGNLIKQMDTRGQPICFFYDEMNRLVGKQYVGEQDNLDTVECDYDPEHWYPEDGDVILYTYDDTVGGNFGLGRRTSMVDGSGSTAWAYDAAGRVISESKIILQMGATGIYTPVYTTAFTYDSLGRVKTMTYPDGEVVTYTYGAGGQIDGLVSSYGDVYLESVAYNALGQPTAQSLGAGALDATFTYYEQTDGDNGEYATMLASMNVANNTGNLLSLGNYTYHPDGNLKRTAAGAVGTSAFANLQYVYNDLNWLENATGVVNGESHTWDYEYDKVGNLTTKDGLTYDYTNAPAHAPTGVGITMTLGYDANGNRAVYTDTSESVILTYNYDAENRLQSVVSGTNNSLASFVYDGDGNRVEEQSSSNNAVYVNGYYEIAPWTESVTLYGEQGNNPIFPDMVSGVTGTLYLAWIEGQDAVRFATRDSDTGTWSAPETIANDSNILWRALAIAVDSDGNVAIAWEVQTGSMTSAVQACLLPANGSACNVLANIPNEMGTYNSHPSLAITADGAVHLAWQTGNGKIRVKSFGETGWRDVNNASLPALASDPQGNLYLAYVHTGQGIYLQRRNNQGQWSAAPELVSEEASTNGLDALALVCDDQGNLNIGWQESTSVSLVRRSAQNTAWGQPIYVGLGANAHGIDLTVDPINGLHWTSISRGDNEAGSVRTNEGDFRKETINALHTTIATGSENTLVVVWSGTNTSTEDTRLYISYKTPIKHYYAGNQRIATRVDNQVYYFLSDHLGSTAVIVDADGNEVGHILYDPYGGILTNTIPLTVSDRLFTGQRWNATLNLYDYVCRRRHRARFYDPALGQFTQPDSLIPESGNPTAWNRYAYTYNNPLNYTDPSGHSAIGLALGALAIAGAVWDGADLLADMSACFGDNQSLACYMLPFAAAAVVSPVDGPEDNAARAAARQAERTAYLVGGGGFTGEAVEQVFELAGKYHHLEIVDADPDAVQVLELLLNAQGGKPSNVRIRTMAAADLGSVPNADIFFVAPNPVWVVNTLADDFDKVVGLGSRGYIVSELPSLKNYISTPGSVTTGGLDAIGVYRKLDSWSSVFMIPNTALPSGNVKIYSSYFGHEPHISFIHLTR